MATTIQKLIQQAVIAAAAPMIVSCGSDNVYQTVVISDLWTDGGPVPSVLTSSECASICNPEAAFGCPNPNYQGCKAAGPSGDGGIAVSCLGSARTSGSNVCGYGRRPPGLANLVARGSAVGRYFAEAAYLEAASIRAFRQLQSELVVHGAPATLVRGAARAQADEVRHARSMARLARRFGVRVPRVKAARPQLRPLEEVIADNAVEGRINETMGAALAAWTARFAADAEVVEVMKGVALDEAEHARLGGDIHLWGLPRLGRSGQRRVAAREEQALAELARAPAPAPEVRALTGHPDDAQRSRLLTELTARLWRQRPQA